MTSYWCEGAWLPGGPAERVRIVVERGVITAVIEGAAASDGDEVLPGLVLPGFANVHSHAFHRALRGRTHEAGGDFWSWREAMYEVAAALTPEAYYELARAVYAEMVLAGVSAVGEFHYLHHRRSGGRYRDANAMGEALRAGASDAGIRLTLLDTCYLTGGIGQELTGVQRRFGDGSAEAWAARVETLRADPMVRIGAAVHSVRAVPPDQIALVAAWARSRGIPLHVHLSEQPAENADCLAAYGRTPTQVLHDAGALHAGTTVVHAVHLTPGDLATIGSSGATAALCPTTERDLADGIAPAAALRDAGSPLALGSDQHATIDLLAEAHALEMHERLRSGRRGVFDPADLVTALTTAGHRAIGWPEVGALSVGAPADLVAVRTDTVRTAGASPRQLVMAATASDVDTVVIAGRCVVRGGRHVIGDAGALLGDVVERLLAPGRKRG